MSDVLDSLLDQTIEDLERTLPAQKRVDAVQREKREYSRALSRGETPRPKVKGVADRPVARTSYVQMMEESSRVPDADPSGPLLPPTLAASFEGEELAAAGRRFARDLERQGMALGREQQVLALAGMIKADKAGYAERMKKRLEMPDLPDDLRQNITAAFALKDVLPEVSLGQSAEGGNWFGGAGAENTEVADLLKQSLAQSVPLGPKKDYFVNLSADPESSKMVLHVPQAQEELRQRYVDEYLNQEGLNYRTASKEKKDELYRRADKAASRDLLRIVASGRDTMVIHDPVSHAEVKKAAEETNMLWNFASYYMARRDVGSAWAPGTRVLEEEGVLDWVTRIGALDATAAMLQPVRDHVRATTPEAEGGIDYYAEAGKRIWDIASDPELRQEYEADVMIAMSEGADWLTEWRLWIAEKETALARAGGATEDEAQALGREAASAGDVVALGFLPYLFEPDLIGGGLLVLGGPVGWAASRVGRIRKAGLVMKSGKVLVKGRVQSAAARVRKAISEDKSLEEALAEVASYDPGTARVLELKIASDVGKARRADGVEGTARTENLPAVSRFAEGLASDEATLAQDLTTALDEMMTAGRALDSALPDIDANEVAALRNAADRPGVRQGMEDLAVSSLNAARAAKQLKAQRKAEVKGISKVLLAERKAQRKLAKAERALDASITALERAVGDSAEAKKLVTLWKLEKHQFGVMRAAKEAGNAAAESAAHIKHARLKAEVAQARRAYGQAPSAGLEAALREGASHGRAVAHARMRLMGAGNLRQAQQALSSAQGGLAAAKAAEKAAESAHLTAITRLGVVFPETLLARGARVRLPRGLGQARAALKGLDKSYKRAEEARRAANWKVVASQFADDLEAGARQINIRETPREHLSRWGLLIPKTGIPQKEIEAVQKGDPLKHGVVGDTPTGFRVDSEKLRDGLNKAYGAAAVGGAREGLSRSHSGRQLIGLIDGTGVKEVPFALAEEIRDLETMFTHSALALRPSEREYRLVLQIIETGYEMNLVRGARTPLKAIQASILKPLRWLGRSLSPTVSKVGRASEVIEVARRHISDYGDRYTNELTAAVSHGRKQGKSEFDSLFAYLDGRDPLPMVDGLTSLNLSHGQTVFQRAQKAILADMSGRAEVAGIADDVEEAIRDPNVNVALLGLSRAWWDVTRSTNKTGQAATLYGLAYRNLLTSTTAREFSDKMKAATAATTEGVEMRTGRAAGMMSMGLTQGAMTYDIAALTEKSMAGLIDFEQARDLNRLVGRSGDRLGAWDVDNMDAALDAAAIIGKTLSEERVRTTTTNVLGSVNERGAALGRELRLVEAGDRTGLVTADLLRASSERMSGYVKALDSVNLDPPNAIGANAMAGANKTARWMKRAMTAGILIPNPKYHTLNYFGDFSQVWWELGLPEAAKFGIQALPAHFPLVGRALQDHVSRMSEKFKGAPVLDTIFGSLTNGHINRFWNGDPDFVMRLPDGPHRAQELRKWALEDGIFDTQVAGELLDQLKTSYSRLSGGSAGDMPRAFKGWQQSLEDSAMAIQQRQRVGLWLRLLDQGYSRKEAGVLVQKALYDWKHGMSQAEMVVASVFPFARYFRLAANQGHRALTDVLTRPSGEAVKAILQGKTGTARARQMMLTEDRLFPAMMGQDPEPESGEDALARAMRPAWGREYPNVVEKMTPEQRLEEFRKTGYDKTYYMKVHPQFSARIALEMATLPYRAMVALTTAAVSEDYELSAAIGSRALTSVSDKMFPGMREVVESAGASFGLGPEMPHSQQNIQRLRPRMAGTYDAIFGSVGFMPDVRQYQDGNYYGPSWINKLDTFLPLLIGTSVTSFMDAGYYRNNAISAAGESNDPLLAMKKGLMHWVGIQRTYGMSPTYSQQRKQKRIDFHAKKFLDEQTHKAH
jgi:hypothetical protein